MLVAGSGSRPQSSCAKQLGMEQGEYPFAGSCAKQLGMEQSVYHIAGGDSSCAKQLGMEQGEYLFETRLHCSVVGTSCVWQVAKAKAAA